MIEVLLIGGPRARALRNIDPRIKWIEILTTRGTWKYAVVAHPVIVHPSGSPTVRYFGLCQDRT